MHGWAGGGTAPHSPPAVQGGGVGPERGHRSIPPPAPEKQNRSGGPEAGCMGVAGAALGAGGRKAVPGGMGLGGRRPDHTSLGRAPRLAWRPPFAHRTGPVSGRRLGWATPAWAGHRGSTGMGLPGSQRTPGTHPVRRLRNHSNRSSRFWGWRKRQGKRTWKKNCDHRAAKASSGQCLGTHHPWWLEPGGPRRAVRSGRGCQHMPLHWCEDLLKREQAPRQRWGGRCMAAW